MATAVLKRSYPQDAERVDNEVVTRRVESFIDYANEFFLRAAFYRVSDVGLQKSGIDLVMNDPNARPGELRAFLVDEKAAVKYMNKDLTTYSFELSSDNNKDKQGWFLSSTSKTTHYELVWPRSRNDGHTIDSATIAIVSKDAVNKWLAEKGVDPQKILEQMRSQFHGDKSVCHYDNCQYQTQTNYSGRPSKHTMTVEGIKVVQSLNGKENPINILIPKDVLCALAEREKTYYEHKIPIHVEHARQLVAETRDKTYSIDNYMNLRDWQRFEQTGTLPPGIKFVRNGIAKNGVSTRLEDGKRVLNLRDGDRLYVKTPYGRDVCLGVYAERKQMWGITGPASQTLGPEKSFSISDRIKESLQQGKLPFGFVVANATFSRQLSLDDLQRPRHGDSIVTFGENTQNQVVHLWYNAYTNNFVLNDNKFIHPEELPVFRGIKVISERENDLKRAMMDRIVNCIPEIRKQESLSQPELFDKMSKLLRNPQFLWTTPMNRASAEGIALKELMTSKSLTEKQLVEKSNLESALPNPQNVLAVQRLAGSLVSQIASLTKEQRNDPDLLAALLYDKKHLELARESYVQGNPRTAPALDLEKLAHSLGYPTQSNKPFISWTNETIQHMTEYLNATCDKSKVIVLTGPVPAWAMASIAQGVEGAVYLRSDAYTTIRCESATKVPNLQEHQGITFEVEKSSDGKTTTLTWSLSGKLSAEEIQKLQVPDISPCENLVLQSRGKSPAFVLANMVKAYEDRAGQIISTRHPDQYDDNRSHGGTCIFSHDKSQIGEFVPAHALVSLQKSFVQQHFEFDRRTPIAQYNEMSRHNNQRNGNQKRGSDEHELALV